MLTSCLQELVIGARHTDSLPSITSTLTIILKKSWDGRDREWNNPTGNFVWKARFAPDQTGTWMFKLAAQDASGSFQSTTQSFTVVPSDAPGFLKLVLQISGILSLTMAILL